MLLFLKTNAKKTEAFYCDVQLRDWKVCKRLLAVIILTFKAFPGMQYILNVHQVTAPYMNSQLSL